MTQSYSVSPAEAATELLRRRAARRSLLRFTEYTSPNWQPGKLHRIVCEHLDAVIRHEIDRLLLLCPPQHGKSHIASRRAPAMILGIDPTQDVISASATTDLAAGFGRDVRNCIASQEYQALYPGTRLSEDSQARGKWHTQAGGGYFAVGVGAQLYGKGGMAIIDDPFGSWAEAQSETERKNVWEWYRGTLYNRVRPGQPIVVIQHRMHEDDLVGLLLQNERRGGDKWVVVELPALLDDPPWPERYDRAALERIKANTDPRQWSALYMQNPTPEEGTYFKREWFKWYDETPKHLATLMAGDFAVSEDRGDMTELGVGGVNPDDDLYVAPSGGWWSGQTSPDKWIDALLDLAYDHRPDVFVSEKGVIKNSVEPFLAKRSRERRIYLHIEWLAHIGDKTANARAFQARAASGKVYLPDNDIGHRILNQLLAFPGGKFDDIVDVLGLMGRYLQDMRAGFVPKPAPEVPIDLWGKRKQVGNWKVQ